MSDEYRFGIEEEYFLVDAETKSVAREMPQAFLEKLKSVTDGQVMGEMLQSQLEVATEIQRVAGVWPTPRGIARGSLDVCGAPDIRWDVPGRDPTRPLEREEPMEGGTTNAESLAPSSVERSRTWAGPRPARPPAAAIGCRLWGASRLG